MMDIVMDVSPPPLLLPWAEEQAATVVTRASAASAQAALLNLALGELASLPPRTGEAPLLWSMLSPFAHSCYCGAIAA